MPSCRRLNCTIFHSHMHYSNISRACVSPESYCSYSEGPDRCTISERDQLRVWLLTSSPALDWLGWTGLDRHSPHSPSPVTYSNSQSLYTRSQEVQNRILEDFHFPSFACTFTQTRGLWAHSTHKPGDSRCLTPANSSYLLRSADFIRNEYSAISSPVFSHRLEHFEGIQLPNNCGALAVTFFGENSQMFETRRPAFEKFSRLGNFLRRRLDGELDKEREIHDKRFSPKIFGIWGLLYRNLMRLCSPNNPEQHMQHTQNIHFCRFVHIHVHCR